MYDQAISRARRGGAGLLTALLLMACQPPKDVTPNSPPSPVPLPTDAPRTPMTFERLQGLPRCFLRGKFRSDRVALDTRATTRSPIGTYTMTWIKFKAVAITDEPKFFSLPDELDPRDNSGRPPRPPQKLITFWVDPPDCPAISPAEPVPSPTRTPAPPPPMNPSSGRPPITIEELAKRPTRDLGDHPNDASALAAHRAAGAARGWSTGFIGLQGVAISPEGVVYDMPVQKAAEAQSGPGQRPPQRARIVDAPRP